MLTKMGSISMQLLEGKASIVTGGSTGIGEGISKRFASDGAAVLVNGLPGDPVHAVVEEIRQSGGQAAGFEGDISNPDTARECVEAAVKAFGRLDVLVNNAGIFHVTGETQDLSVEDIDTMTRHNVRSAVLMTKYAIPHLRGTKGTVLFTASEAGTIGQPECSIYGGTKGYLISFARGVALEQAKYGLRANVVCPGPTKTQWHDTAVSSMTEEMEAQILKTVPLGRHANPEEIANVFSFLASDRASFVTGALYFADGGLSIARGTPGKDMPADLAKPPQGGLDLRHSAEGMENISTHRAG